MPEFAQEGRKDLHSPQNCSIRINRENLLSSGSLSLSRSLNLQRHSEEADQPFSAENELDQLKENSDSLSSSFGNKCLGCDFDRISIYPSSRAKPEISHAPLAIQAKLKVGPAGDKYEQEADQVAEQVMRLIEAKDSKPIQGREKEDEDKVQGKSLAPGLSPFSEHQGEEEELQAKPLAAAITPLIQKQGEEEEEVQTKLDGIISPKSEIRDPHDGFEAGGEFESQLNRSRGGGSPLPEGLRGQMEQGFGADFGGVHVHTGSESAQLNRAVSAQAFTYGQDIYLGAGKSDLQSSEGLKLIAHELTHVMQQIGHVQRVEPGDGGTLIARQGSFQPRGKDKQIQTKPSPSAHRGPTLAASITAMGSAEGIQRIPAPLFHNSAIQYDATIPHLFLNAYTPKGITIGDHATLVQAITSMIANNVDGDSIDHQLGKYLNTHEKQYVLPLDLVVKQFQLIATYIPSVNARRQADEAALRGGPVGANPPTTAGPALLAAEDLFQAYELTGADPHKDGEAPLFLRYATASGQIKRIVYKPTDLTPELVLYGGHEFGVVQFGGTYAQAVAPGHPPGAVGNVHGYMTFITEEGPRDARDVEGIYRSLGEGLALGYVYGLRDLHHENYLMRRDHIQWIDLEAMTATFESMAEMDILRLFGSIGNKMTGVLKSSIEPGPNQWFRGVRRSINRRKLINELRVLDFENLIRTGFDQKKANIPAASQQAAQWVTRFVPFPTEELYHFVADWHNEPQIASPNPSPNPNFPPPAWSIDLRQRWDNSLSNLTYTGPRNEVLLMMNALRTRQAIGRGDIPFFMRQGEAILDEQGDEITHQSIYHRVIAQPFGNIQKRLNDPTPVGLLTYPINMVRGMHNKLITDLSQ